VKVLRWSATTWRKIEAARDRIMFGLGTGEPYVEERGTMSVHWRRPLSIEEINQMAPTEEVRERRGRP